MSLGIKYYWKEYAVILKASSKALQRYQSNILCQDIRGIRGLIKTDLSMKMN